ncbi:MAG: glycosyltransferase family 1 protein [Desulfopila sp.]|jgi:glycosyltransferase involved in cell wall biosynthesis|nr:glycosyltransferase family 1 protein [Desulfopila sp.]
MKKIVIVTDAWHPQINGVVTTLGKTITCLEKFGYCVETITPQLFRSFPCPTYPEISLSLAGTKRLREQLLSFKPHCVHIATEGPLGWAARSICRSSGFAFSTSYHTRFPEYVRMRWPVPLSLSYRVLRCFHNAAAKTMVATSKLKAELEDRGFSNMVLWSRGVDLDLFKPEKKRKDGTADPVFLYVGRVAIEKNITAFLELDLPGTKMVVGDGPARHQLADNYPAVTFTGYKKGAELAALYAAADVLVFPSLTDTFGVVLLEAMASGVPVAAYPVTGPLETVVNGENGYLDNDLRSAAIRALGVPGESCRKSAMRYTWEACSKQFLNNLSFNDAEFSA